MDHPTAFINSLIVTSKPSGKKTITCKKPTMIGKVIVFVAVAVSCSTALPFGNCGNWDSPAFGNLVGTPGNIISGGLNLPGPGPIIEGSAFPGNNILTPASNILPANIINQGVPNNLPPFPTPSVSGPTVSGPIVGGIQRFAGPVTFPNIPFQGQLVQTSPIQVQNIETRVPTIHARFPTIQARFPTFDSSLPGFQGNGVFQGANSQFPC